MSDKQPLTDAELVEWRSMHDVPLSETQATRYADLSEKNARFWVPIPQPPLSPSDIARTNELAEKLGWC